MIYYRGTLAEFVQWHNAAKISEGLPAIGYMNGNPAPGNQESVDYSNAIQNPNKSDDYIWLYGRYPINGKTDLSQTDIDNLNWFPINN